MSTAIPGGCICTMTGPPVYLQSTEILYMILTPSGFGLQWWMAVRPVSCHIMSKGSFSPGQHHCQKHSPETGPDTKFTDLKSAVKPLASTIDLQFTVIGLVTSSLCYISSITKILKLKIGRRHQGLLHKPHVCGFCLRKGL